MTTLIFAQTLFYFTVSFAIIGIAILVGVIVCNLIKITRGLHNILENLEQASDDLIDRVDDVLDSLVSLPILSMFFRPKKRARKTLPKKKV